MEQLVLDLNSTSFQWDTKDEMLNIHDWFLMSSPMPVAGIMISYWLFVLKLGPMYMKSREPLQVMKYLVAYNIFQVFVSFNIVIVAINCMRTYGIFSSICPGDPVESKMLLTSSCYTFLLAKITELLDTVFFVLKKNDRQVSFLHVYHHSVAVIVTWIALKLDSVYPSVAILGGINGMVHVVMYTYYGLSAFPSMVKYLWWKKYITTLQLVQFFTIIAHHFVSYKIGRCEEFDILFLAVIFHLFLFVCLFLDFYIKTYIQNKNMKTDLGSNSNCNGQNKIKQN
ncbi:elongation of very long chain fatty acids protein 4-like isoform X1 [Maniola jurtina]|uniref:elongation of very long chain fatty acids protein 4-like isoform X1 n=2 Tax=Maniola jurtina TaxID=191418 RepID=UPI001E68A961|nr:elongation of very long chain fatty acids protein 4-like isoform X1 [Maniola jurtina]